MLFVQVNGNKSFQRIRAYQRTDDNSSTFMGGSIFNTCPSEQRSASTLGYFAANINDELFLKEASWHEDNR
jgi:hypothetical protein